MGRCLGLESPVDFQMVGPGATGGWPIQLQSHRMRGKVGTVHAMSFERNKSEDQGGPANPFAKMADLGRRHGANARREGVDGEKLADVLELAASLKRIHDWAGAMQQGAEGFDNLSSARAYSRLQEHILAAAQDLAYVAEILHERARPWRI